VGEAWHGVEALRSCVCSIKLATMSSSCVGALLYHARLNWALQQTGRHELPHEAARLVCEPLRAMASTAPAFGADTFASAAMKPTVDSASRYVF
jgi:hypothetical protein